jgi:hypothetical protein
MCPPLSCSCPAESREESLLLAKQLAAAKADLQKAKAASSKLGRQLETEQLLRTDAEGAAEALKQRLEKLLDGSKEASRSRTDMAEVIEGTGQGRCVCLGGVSNCLSPGCLTMHTDKLCPAPRQREGTTNSGSFRCGISLLGCGAVGAETCAAVCCVCACVQQLAAAKSDAEALRAERDQLAEVLLEMQVSGQMGCVAAGAAADTIRAARPVQSAPSTFSQCKYAQLQSLQTRLELLPRDCSGTFPFSSPHHSFLTRAFSLHTGGAGPAQGSSSAGRGR